MKKIVIIGGGFAGINLANGLAGKKEFQVTVVDRNNYNFFPPLLYQVATGYLEPSNICYPFRRLWRGKKNISYHMAEFQRVIISEKKEITIVVAGAGPTGVEVSGMLAEMKKKVVPKDYPELAGRGYESHIYLVD